MTPAVHPPRALQILLDHSGAVGLPTGRFRSRAARPRPLVVETFTSRVPSGRRYTVDGVYTSVVRNGSRSAVILIKR